LETNPVRKSVTFLIQHEIRAESEAEYKQKRDRVIRELKKEGWSVSVESETDESDLMGVV